MYYSYFWPLLFRCMGKTQQNQEKNIYSESVKGNFPFLLFYKENWHTFQHMVFECVKKKIAKIWKKVDIIKQYKSDSNTLFFIKIDQ